ncbi:hypothetical protein HAHE_26870 [Haloferula helveola]|uniref:FecR protein n=1 Tax=Haloferula helveola TaxID=490095 RepID=A0ABN6H815_9BACT|nr:hypothetical protein HAHE_26870 [Haloferula helveola]
MSSDERKYQDLSRRLSRLVDGLLDETEAAELDQLLRDDPDARTYYREFVTTHLELEEHFEMTAGAPVPFQPRRRPIIPLAIAALLAGVLGLGIWFANRDFSVPTEAPVATVTGPVLGVTARSEGVQWNLSAAPSPGLQLRTGPVELKSGTLLIELAAGQLLTVRAPAAFELLTDTEMLLTKGEAALEMADGEDAYIIRVPSGAVVDLGTAFAVKVSDSGVADVHVFEGLVNATTTDSGGRTRADRLLHEGDSVRITDTLVDSPEASETFLRPLAQEAIPPSPAGNDYAEKVRGSEPAAWWRFESTSDDTIPSETASAPLKINGTPLVAGSGGRGFLLTDKGQHSGFVAPDAGIPELDTESGFTVEMLVHPTAKDYGSIVIFENFDRESPKTGPFSHVKHRPQQIALERMGRRGNHIGHIHPDFAIRALTRTPAGYDGGVNVYSNEAYLLHRWIHIAFTRSGSELRLYIDGRLSDEMTTELPFLNATLRPIIGRLQPLEKGEKRQWQGGIDEVALYSRVLGADEVRDHFGALSE